MKHYSLTSDCVSTTCTTYKIIICQSGKILCSDYKIKGNWCGVEREKHNFVCGSEKTKNLSSGKTQSGLRIMCNNAYFLLTDGLDSK